MPVSEVHNIDCLEFMKQYPDKYFELAIVDIPYGINVGKMAYLSEVKTTVKQKNGNKLNGNANKRPYQLKDWDNRPPEQTYFDELRRVSKNQIVFGIEYTKWDGVGTGRIKWDKGIPDGMSFKRYEVAYCSIISNTITIQLLWAGMQQAKSLSEPMIQQGNKSLNEKRIHPRHKPTLLYKKLLSDYAKEGDKILDTHLGSGSSRIAAYIMGFDFYACEIDKDYYEAQEKRFKEQTAQQSLFGFDNLNKAV
jgi:site-specific DNA-methyltransferase (adenine-specific)